MEEEEKIKQSRAERSTKCFYDASYWDDYWITRFKTQYNPQNPVNRHEAEKRVNFIKRHYKDVKKVLDVGCGLGYMLSRARAEKIECFGVDVSRAAIERAPSPVRKFIKETCVTKTGFKDNEFELITIFDLLEHLFIEEILAAVEEVSRVASKFILMRSPMTGWGGERCIVDHAYRAEDKSHVSIYPWDFWVRQFSAFGKFVFHFATMYAHEEENVVDVWLSFKRKE